MSERLTPERLAEILKCLAEGRGFHVDFQQWLDHIEALEAELRQAESQVAMLVGALQRAVMDWENDYGTAPRYLTAALANTEAAAKAHDQRLRVEGARAGIQRIIDRAEVAWQRGAPYKDAGYVAKLVLVDMEREQEGQA